MQHIIKAHNWLADLFLKIACIKHSSGEHNTNSEKLKEIQSVIFRHFVLAAPEQE